MILYRIMVVRAILPQVSLVLHKWFRYSQIVVVFPDSMPYLWLTIHLTLIVAGAAFSSPA